MNNEGKRGEKIASSFLAKRGYRIIDRNFRFGRRGEIDIIATYKKSLIFIEVKMRNNGKYGDAIYSINKTKIRRIIKTAKYFLVKNRLYNEIDVRFDVITIDYKNGQEQVKHIINAFKGAI